MNTKGTKFLAVLAVLAMAFAAFAVITPSEENDAASTAGSGYDPAKDGPIDFNATLSYEGYGTWSNAILGNDIKVTYDKSSKTYTVKGTLANQDVDDTTTAFVKLGPPTVGGSKVEYGIAFAFNATEAGTMTLSGPSGIEGSETFTGAGCSECLVYIPYLDNGEHFKVVFGGTTYKIDITGVELANSNALSIHGQSPTSGTDGADGTWGLVGTTLTLNNYKGKEYFSGAFIKLVVEGDCSITVDGTNNAILTSVALDIETSSSGKLTIKITNPTAAAYAIQAGGAINVKGVDLDIFVDSKADASAGIYATGTSAITFDTVKSISINMGDLAYKSYGIKSATAAAVNIKNVGIVSDQGTYNMTVSAGYGIDANALTFKAAVVNVNSSYIGLNADSIVTETAASYVSSALTYEIDDPSIVPYAARVANTSTLSYDSVFEFDNYYSAAAVTVYPGTTLTVNSGWVLAGALNDNGTVNNNGNMLVLGAITLNDDNAVFNNTGSIKITKYNIALNDYLSADETNKLVKVNSTPSAAATDGNYFVQNIRFVSAEYLADGSIYANVELTLMDDDISVKVSSYGELTFFPKDTTGCELWVHSFAGTTKTYNTTTKEYEYLYVNIDYTYTSATDTLWSIQPSGKAFSESLRAVTLDSSIPYETGTAVHNAAAVGVAAAGNLTVTKGEFITSTVVTTENVLSTLINGGKYTGDLKSSAGYTNATTYGVTLVSGTFEGSIDAAVPVQITNATVTGSITVNNTGDGNDCNILFTEGTMKGNLSADGKVTLGNTSTSKVTMSDGDIIAKEVLIDEGSKVTGNVKVTADSTISGTLMGDLTVDAGYANAGTLKVVLVEMEGDLIFTGKYLATPVTGEVTDADKSVFTIEMAIDMNNSATTIKMKPATNATASVAAVQPYFILDSSIAASNNVGTPAAPHESTFELVSGELQITRNVTIPANNVLKVDSGTTLTIVGKNYNLDAQGAVIVSLNATLNDSLADSTKYGKIKSVTYYSTDTDDVWCGIDYAVANATGKDITVSETVSLTAKAIAAGTTVIVTENSNLTLTDSVTMGEGASIMIVKGTVTLTQDKTYNGTISFDDNILILKDLELNTANGTIVSVDETTGDGAQPAMLNVTMTYGIGSAELAKGYMKGAITLNQDSIVSGTTTYYAGALIIDAGTVSYATVTDAAMDGHKKITSVTVNGTMDVSASAVTINGSYSGLGTLVIGTSAIVVKNTADVDLLVLDESNNGFDLVKVVNIKSGTATYDFTLQATKAAGTEPAFVTLSSGAQANIIAYSGEFVACGTVKMKDFTIPNNVTLSVPADATATILAGAAGAGNVSVEATGLFKQTGTVNMYVSTEVGATLGKLKYQVKYDEDATTVYTSLKGALDAGVAKDLTVDTLELPGETVTVPAGVTVTVTKTLTIPADCHLIIGTPADSVGADAPGKIVGDVVIAADENAFLLIYADAYSTLDEMNIYSDAGKTVKAVNSEFTINNKAYATVFGGTATKIGKVYSTVLPSITGYAFKGWDPAFTADTATLVGAVTNYNGTATPYVYYVTFNDVAGINYFVGGTQVVQTGVPLAVNYGDYITAMPADGYQGTAVVNNAKAIMVTGDLVVTGAGVEPIPEPEPESESDWTITTILLLVLVVLIAIMAVIVALRLNRS